MPQRAFFEATLPQKCMRKARFTCPRAFLALSQCVHKPGYMRLQTALQVLQVLIKIILTDPHSHELTRSRHSVPSGTDTEAANGYNRTKRVTVQKGHVRLRPRATGQQQVHSLTFRYSSSSGKLYSSAKSWSSFWLMSASAAAAAGSKSASSAAGALPAASSCVRSAAAFTI